LRPWLWTGVWLALGFLSKNTNAFQLVCFGLFFALWKPARAQLRTRGPWLALGIVGLAVLPQLVWNAQHGWATVEHLHNRAGLDQAWKFTPNYLIDFAVAELALLNPCWLALILGGVMTTLVQFRTPKGEASASPSGGLTLFLFCMGAPLFLGYFLYTLRARVQPNWIVPAVLPLLCLAALQAEACWKNGVRSVRGWFVGGLALGLPLVVLLHDTNLAGKLLGAPLPAKSDPLVRVRGWKALAGTVEAERQRVIAAEGKPVFLIGAHYGITSLLSFYIPEARAGVPQSPVVYYQSSEKPENQYGFWPGYASRRGGSALYVQELKKGAIPEPPPARLAAEFARIEDLGIRDVEHRGRTIHTVRLLLCRELK
ncbi:MAG: glycosyltransferase family 39 protein, partial [Limisphaerales bacterium]